MHKFSPNDFSKINPQVKFFYLFELIICSLIFNHPCYLIVFLILFLTITVRLKILREFSSYFKICCAMGIFIFVFNILLNREGETILLNLTISNFLSYNLVISLEVLVFSSISLLSLVLIIFYFGIFNKIIEYDEMMKLFTRFKVPNSINFLLTISFRFFPLLVNDLEQINDVQRSRGFELDGKNLILKIKNRIVLLLPLLTNSLDRSIQMAEALESRGFGLNKNKTDYFQLNSTVRDRITIFLSFLLVIFALIMRFLGFGIFNPFPVFSEVLVTSVDYIVPLILLISNVLLFHLILGGVKNHE